MKPRNRIAMAACGLAIVAAIGTYVYWPSGDSKNNYAHSEEKGEVTSMVMPAEEGKCDFLENFKTLDVYGNEVDSSVFSDYKITIVDVWGTYCNPCIKAMPTLQQLFEEYGDRGLNVVGILCDAQNADGSPIPDKILLARDIMDSCGVTFGSILISGNIMQSVMPSISAIPTSFFVDSGGNIVGRMHLGGKPLPEWRGMLDEII